MCSLENLDATDTIPKENSGISVDQTVEPNLTPTIPSPYAEKVRFSRRFHSVSLIHSSYYSNPPPPLRAIQMYPTRHRLHR